MDSVKQNIPSAKPPLRIATPALVSFLCANGVLLLVALMLPAPAHPHAVVPVAWITEPEPDATDAPDDQAMRECVITLTSGRTITGELIREDSRIVVIGIEGIETTFQRRLVSSIVVLPPVAERYRDLRATISDDDIDARLALVEWLRARRAYALALRELESILLLEPNNSHAKLLHTWLAEYDKLSRSEQPQDKDQETASPEEAQSPPAKEPRAYQIRRNELPLLSDEQINLMRVYEIDLRNPPRIKVPDDVIQELIQRNPEAFSPNEDERQAVFDLPGIEKLKLLFSLKSRDLYARVQVLENPSSIKRFKDQVHNGRGWLINACASTRCHGGVDAGSFQLINDRPNTDETVFTNLYIIENTKLSNGLPLIDYNSPERSPLLQMGMIESNALVPHPEIPRGYPGTGYRPIFRNTRDRKYQQAVDWIRSMYQPRPEYGFDYPPKPETTLPDPDQNQP